MTAARSGDGPTAASSHSLWDANDVAAFLKVSRSWVYQRSASGQLPSLHVGGLLRFEPTTIRAWLHAKTADVISIRGHGE